MDDDEEEREARRLALGTSAESAVEDEWRLDVWWSWKFACGSEDVAVDKLDPLVDDSSGRGVGGDGVLPLRRLAACDAEGDALAGGERRLLAEGPGAALSTTGADVDSAAARTVAADVVTTTPAATARARIDRRMGSRVALTGTVRQGRMSSTGGVLLDAVDVEGRFETGARTGRSCGGLGGLRRAAA